MCSIKKRVKTGMNIVSLFIIAIFACACRQTPEKAPVIYGGDLEKKLAGSPAPFGAYDAPANWRETLEMKGSDTKIEIDAEIRVPDVSAFPVYKVKPASFAEVRIESLVSYFAEDREVYKTSEATKADLEAQVILARKNNDEETVAMYESMIAAAPETAETEKITDWSADKSPSGSFLDEDGEYAGISVLPDIFMYGKGLILTDSMLLLNDMDRIGEVAISREDAIAAAQDMLHKLGIDNMAADSLEKAQRYARLSNSAYPQLSEKPASKGYFIKFARNVDGIPGITSHGTYVSMMDDFDYRAPLYPEEIRIYADETGKIQSFVWRHPLETEETVTENAGLLPFEEVKQRIRDMLTFIDSYDSQPIEVTSIEMKMAIVNVKDRPDEAMYVPAWFIDYTETDESGTIEYRLVLNAADGGRVLELPIDSDTQRQMDKAREDHLNKN